MEAASSRAAGKPGGRAATPAAIRPADGSADRFSHNRGREDAQRMQASTHRWRLVVALGFTQITAWGSVYYVFALLLPHLHAQLGTSKEAVVGAFSLALLTSGLLAPWVGRRIDRHGGRWLMSAGSILGALGLVLLSRVDSLAQLYFAWLLLGVSMAATLYDPAFAVLARVFDQGYRRAITVLTLFGGFASTVFWPLTQLLIDRYGWRDATALLGLFNLLLCLPLHLLFVPARGRTPAAATAAPSAASASASPGRSSRDLRAALREPAFYLLCGAFTANALVFSAMAVHMLPMLVDKGLTPLQAAAIGALAGPMQVLGRAVEMLFGGRFRATQVALVATGLLPLSLLLFHLLGPMSLGYLAFAFLYGAGNGVTTIVRGAIPAELYGRDHYGAINGALAAPVLVAKASGPLVAAMVWTLSGGYGALPLALAAVAALSVLLLLLLRAPRAQSTSHA